MNYLGIPSNASIPEVLGSGEDVKKFPGQANPGFYSVTG